MWLLMNIFVSHNNFSVFCVSVDWKFLGLKCVGNFCRFVYVCLCCVRFVFEMNCNCCTVYAPNKQNQVNFIGMTLVFSVQYSAVRRSYTSGTFFPLFFLPVFNNLFLSLFPFISSLVLSLSLPRHDKERPTNAAVAIERDEWARKK